MTVGDVVRRFWFARADDIAARAADIAESAAWHIQHAGDDAPVPETLPLQLLAELADALKALAERVKRLEERLRPLACDGGEPEEPIRVLSGTRLAIGHLRYEGPEATDITEMRAVVEVPLHPKSYERVRHIAHDIDRSEDKKIVIFDHEDRLDFVIYFGEHDSPKDSLTFRVYKRGPQKLKPIELTCTNTMSPPSAR